MILRHTMFYLLFLSLFFSCNKMRNKERPVSKDATQQFRDICLEKKLRTELLNAIIDVPKLQQYIRPPEWRARKQLALLKHPYFNNINTDSLLKFDKPVILLSEDETKKFLIEGYEDFLRFEKVHQKGDTIDVEFRYERQGLLGFFSFKKVNCGWVEIKTDLAEE